MGAVPASQTHYSKLRAGSGKHAAFYVDIKCKAAAGYMGEVSQAAVTGSPRTRTSAGVAFIQFALARVTASERLPGPMSPACKTGRLWENTAESEQ